MAEKKVNINVSIAGRPYSLTINQSDEEEVREAAKRVNQAIKDYSNAFEYKDHQDLFAMMSLQFAANSIHLEYEKTFRDEEMLKKLSEIDDLLAGQLSDEK
ncbi:MAG: cell division protein ZapA [Chlorobi bacterium]|nr:cell division protein ZapA [Chlorobiota bacterium]